MNLWQGLKVPACKVLRTKRAEPAPSLRGHGPLGEASLSRGLSGPGGYFPPNHFS